MANTPRLQRLRKIHADTPVYFITACTNKRRPLLDNAKSHEAFRRFCNSALDRRVHVGKYVLMPDHIHLFVCFGMGAPDLSIWIKSLKNFMSKEWRNQGTEGPHWQKGVFDHVLRSEDSFSEKWKYVRDNPMRAGLVTEAANWPFSGEISRL